MTLSMDDKTCLDCEYCFIEDLWFEIVCKLHGYIGDKDSDVICKDFKPVKEVKADG